MSFMVLWKLNSDIRQSIRTTLATSKINTMVSFDWKFKTGAPKEKLCLCIYVPRYRKLHVCLYLDMYVSIYVCMFLCLSVCFCLHASIYVCIYAYMGVWNICMFICIYVFQYLFASSKKSKSSNLAYVKFWSFGCEKTTTNICNKLLKRKKCPINKGKISNFKQTKNGFSQVKLS